jgi:hypothetical protein
VYVPAAPAPAQPAYFTNSLAVVQQFYQDINEGDIRPLGRSVVTTSAAVMRPNGRLVMTPL